VFLLFVHEALRLPHNGVEHIDEPIKAFHEEERSQVAERMTQYVGSGAGLSRPRIKPAGAVTGRVAHSRPHGHDVM
jgi:hypothetical protein